MSTLLNSSLVIFSLTGLAFGDPHQPLTFYKDVLPILQQRCQACHRPGEIAPMPFLSYEQVRPWAKAIRTAVVQKKMTDPFPKKRLKLLFPGLTREPQKEIQAMRLNP